MEVELRKGQRPTRAVLRGLATAIAHVVENECWENVCTNRAWKVREDARDTLVRSVRKFHCASMGDELREGCDPHARNRKPTVLPSSDGLVQSVQSKDGG